MIDIHFWPTPNSKKVTIFLEECALEYSVVECNIGRGDQFSDEFLRISPNNRMPAIVDYDPPGGGAPMAIFESGAILQYLAEKTGQFCPQDIRGKYEVYQWLHWQMANQGPKTGEAGYFRRLGESFGDQSHALSRFSDEVNRCYGVLNNRLRDRPYVAGEDYTIADMICYPWTVGWKLQGQDINDFKYFRRWFEELSERPALQRGMAVGADMGEDMSKLSDAEKARRRALLYNQRARPAPD